jgi:hypothetical protein
MFNGAVNTSTRALTESTEVFIARERNGDGRSGRERNEDGRSGR